MRSVLFHFRINHTLAARKIFQSKLMRPVKSPKILNCTSELDWYTIITVNGINDKFNKIPNY